MLNSLLQCRSLVKKLPKVKGNFVTQVKHLKDKKKSTSIWNAVLLLPIQAGPTLSAPRGISVRGGGAGGAAAPPVGKKIVLFGQN